MRVGVSRACDLCKWCVVFGLSLSSFVMSVYSITRLPSSRDHNHPVADTPCYIDYWTYRIFYWEALSTNNPAVKDDPNGQVYINLCINCLHICHDDTNPAGCLAKTISGTQITCEYVCVEHLKMPQDVAWATVGLCTIGPGPS